MEEEKLNGGYENSSSNDSSAQGSESVQDDSYTPLPKRVAKEQSYSNENQNYESEPTYQPEDQSQDQDEAEVGEVSPDEVENFFEPVSEVHAEPRKKKHKKRKKKMINDPTQQPVKFGKLLLTQFLMMLPIFGVIYSIIVICKKNANKNLRELGKVCLVWQSISIVMFFVFAFTGGLGYIVEWLLNLLNSPTGFLW